VRESAIEKHLVDRVKAAGGEVRKVQFIGRRGAPDRFVMMPRRFGFWVELKAPGKVAEPHQVREHERMIKMGQRVEVVDSIARVDELMGEV
jgi:hypothetical protein